MPLLATRRPAPPGLHCGSNVQGREGGRGLDDPTGLVLRSVTPRCPPPNIKVHPGLAQDSLGVNFKVVVIAPRTSR